jgi:CxxC-x17-CxxC domain-containing protein
VDLQDKTLVCVDCGKEFIFTVAEQEFYKSKGFTNEPKRCEACRAAKKAAHRGQREMFEVPCAKCGQMASVPFKPTGTRPVLCKKCFDEERAAQNDQTDQQEPMAA